MLEINSTGELQQHSPNGGNAMLGAVLVFEHSRKGFVTARLNSEDDEWYYTTILDDVEGMVNSWEAGESLALRKCLVRSIRPA